MGGCDLATNPAKIICHISGTVGRKYVGKIEQNNLKNAIICSGSSDS